MLENEVLSTEIKKIFEEHKGRYGSIRISKVLKQQGITANRKRVSRLMRTMKLLPKGTRYRYKRYNQQSSSIERPNLLNQSFQTDDRNKVWVVDITYVPTKKVNTYQEKGYIKIQLKLKVVIEPSRLLHPLWNYLSSIKLSKELSV